MRPDAVLRVPGSRQSLLLVRIFALYRKFTLDMAASNYHNRPIVIMESNMDVESPEIDQAAALLAEEILQTHAAILGVHQFASQGGDPAVQRNCMKLA